MKITTETDGTYRFGKYILTQKSGEKYWVCGLEKWMTIEEIAAQVEIDEDQENR